MNIRINNINNNNKFRRSNKINNNNNINSYNKNKTKCIWQKFIKNNINSEKTIYIEFSKKKNNKIKIKIIKKKIEVSTENNINGSFGKKTGTTKN